MPGMVGLITNLPRARAEQELRQMVQKIHHNCAYTVGTWVEESQGVYVGWVARPNSFSDRMPVRNERGDVLVFSGEDCRPPGTPQRLREKGHDVCLDGPCYLVHLYEEDPSFLRGVNGRFHGLLFDRKDRSATLFNDRYGMHRLYYHESNEAFYFAAEAKAILAVRPELRKIDSRGLGELISCGCVLENRTVFDKIFVLPPGSAWAFQNGFVERRGVYFDPREWEEQERLEPEEYYPQLREVFSRNLGNHFEAREKVGMSLTGGLDTRMIMAWHKAAPGTLPCYSFGGPYRDCQDVITARRVASACGQPHQVIPVGQEFLSQYPSYAERTVYLTDGCCDMAHTPDLYVNERAAKIAPVRMTGNYGGEVLRRIRAFRPTSLKEDLLRPELLPCIQAANETYARIIQGHSLSFAVFKQAPWHHYGLLSLEQTQLTLRSPYLDNEFVQTVFRAPDSALASNDVSLRLIHDGDEKLLRIRTDRGLAGNHGRLRSAVSRGLLEFTFKAEYAYDYGMPQWVSQVDHAFSALHLERLFLGRHKFYHFRVWYRDALGDYVRQVLLDPKALSRPYLQGKSVQAVVEGHLKRGENRTVEIHKLLNLELLHRLFIDA
jgi:asparagine synthase (glutamine-hydrolysing)